MAGEAAEWFQGRIWMVWRVVPLQDTRGTLPARRGTMGDVWDGARPLRGPKSNYPVTIPSVPFGRTSVGVSGRYLGSGTLSGCFGEVFSIIGHGTEQNTRWCEQKKGSKTRVNSYWPK